MLLKRLLMTKLNLQQTQKTIKDLILFDSAWAKRKKIKILSKTAIERIGLYRELVYNSFYDLLTSIYPNTYELLKKDWGNLLHQYIEAYPPKSPILNKVGEYFPVFLQNQKSILNKYQFISELAKYEWVELEVYEKEVSDLKLNPKILSLNPAHIVCKFEYPIVDVVELIKNKKSLSDIQKKETNIFIYRDPKDLSVRFFELSSSTLQYVELLDWGFTHNIAIEMLRDTYEIEEAYFKDFQKQANELQKVLKKNRIIL